MSSPDGLGYDLYSFESQIADEYLQLQFLDGLGESELDLRSLLVSPRGGQAAGAAAAAGRSSSQDDLIYLPVHPGSDDAGFGGAGDSPAGLAGARDGSAGLEGVEDGGSALGASGGNIGAGGSRGGDNIGSDPSHSRGASLADRAGPAPGERSHRLSVAGSDAVDVDELLLPGIEQLTHEFAIGRLGSGDWTTRIRGGSWSPVPPPPPLERAGGAIPSNIGSRLQGLPGDLTGSAAWDAAARGPAPPLALDLGDLGPPTLSAGGHDYPDIPRDRDAWHAGHLRDVSGAVTHHSAGHHLPFAHHTSAGHHTSSHHNTSGHHHPGSHHHPGGQHHPGGHLPAGQRGGKGLPPRSHGAVEPGGFRGSASWASEEYGWVGHSPGVRGDAGAPRSLDPPTARAGGIPEVARSLPRLAVPRATASELRSGSSSPSPSPKRRFDAGNPTSRSPKSRRTTSGSTWTDGSCSSPPPEREVSLSCLGSHRRAISGDTSDSAQESDAALAGGGSRARADATRTSLGGSGVASRAGAPRALAPHGRSLRGGEPGGGGNGGCGGEAVAHPSGRDAARPAGSTTTTTTTSQYRGVSRHRLTRRWEASLWLNGRQLYLGGFDAQEAAARAYDLAALACKGPDSPVNFPPETYAEQLREIAGLGRDEVVAYVRRRSAAFSRGKSRYRGVSGHNGRWEARIGSFAGRKNVSFGVFESEEEAARQYDRALILEKGRSAKTNFPMKDYGAEVAKYEAAKEAGGGAGDLLGAWALPGRGDGGGRDAAAAAEPFGHAGRGSDRALGLVPLGPGAQGSYLAPDPNLATLDVGHFVAGRRLPRTTTTSDMDPSSPHGARSSRELSLARTATIGAGGAEPPVEHTALPEVQPFSRGSAAGKLPAPSSLHIYAWPAGAAPRTDGR